MSSQLTQADVKKLLEEPSIAVRESIAQKLAQNIDSPDLNENETQLALDIVRIMAEDIHASVRQALATHLKTSERLPRDVALKLANDVEDVAFPILKYSSVLDEKDLISIIQQGSGAKQSAIATRSGLQGSVSRALITSGEPGAVQELMKNHSAHVSESSLSLALQRFETHDGIKESMAHRETLPVTVAERLTFLVSDQLRDYLVSHHAISDEIAADIVLRSAEKTVVSFSAGREDRDIEQLVQQMHRHQRLSSSIVLRALCTGDLNFFEASLAALASVPLVNARLLIHDQGDTALVSIYIKSGLPPELLPLIKVALAVLSETEMTADQDRHHYKARVIERILTKVQMIDSKDTDYLLRTLSDFSDVSAA